MPPPEQQGACRAARSSTAVIVVGTCSGADGGNRGGMTLITRPVVYAGGRTSDGHTVPPFVGSCSNDDNRGGMTLATRPAVDGGRDDIHLTRPVLKIAFRELPP